jgi:hypothetical protein
LHNHIATIQSSRFTSLKQCSYDCHRGRYSYFPDQLIGASLKLGETRPTGHILLISPIWTCCVPTTYGGDDEGNVLRKRRATGAYGISLQRLMHPPPARASPP